ncbi:MAG: HesA/MoeB/ThiF family protein [Candidatus Lokiarchaeota archaeon]|nr:HesA/MoeB/ThiF family protein [Candidatus Lokiarchaeota archaeon]
MVDLSEKEKIRYGRQILIPEIGEEGQKKLKASSVLVVGTGGLGSIITYYLTAAGIGILGLMDMDTLDLSNLQRQIVHNTDNINMPKTKSAKMTLERLNPNVKFKLFQEPLTPKNAVSIFKDFDFVIDGTDNFFAKFLINDACILVNKPFTLGGVRGFEGQFMTVLPRKTTCYRCLFKEPAPRSKTPLPVLGVTPGVGGLLEATECIKYLIGLKDKLLTDTLILFDLKGMNFDKVAITRDENCPACGKNAKNLLESEKYE